MFSRIGNGTSSAGSTASRGALVLALAAMVGGGIATANAGEVSVRDMVGIAGVPAIVALVELVKLVFPDLSSRYYPLVAIGWGLLINLGLIGYSGAMPIEAVAVGVLAALAASGLYSQTKTVGG